MATSSDARDPRLAAILELIDRIARGDLDARSAPSAEQDEVDAIITGLNMLAEDYARQRDRRRRAEALLEDALDLYDRVPALLCSVDLRRGTIVRGNESLAAFRGVDKEALGGLPFETLCSPASRPRLHEALDRLRRQEAVEEWELELVGAGPAIPAVLSATVVVDLSGRAVRARCIMLDVSARKRLEAQLTQAQKMEAIGRLAGGLAHDFNNVVTVIQSHVELAQDVLPAGSPIADDLEQIDRATDHAAHLTRQLLAFSRRQVMRPEVLDVADAVAETEKLLQRAIGENIELQTVRPAVAWRARIDPHQLEQIVLNLALNARDAMPGGGRLTIETTNVELDEAFARHHPGVDPGAYVRLAFCDEGQGMSDEVLEHVFEPFFTTKQNGEGTGLGLAMCYGIVKQAGGHLWARSEVGVGSTFEILLPRVEGHLAPVESLAGEPAPPFAGGDETLLVVEDDDAVRNVIVRILESAGYRVEVATDGAQALMRYEACDHVDLLVTDVIMPRLGGPEAARLLAARNADLRVLYVSGYADNAIAHRGVLPSDVHYLQKPFAPAALLAKVREVLDAPPVHAKIPRSRTIQPSG